MRSYGSVLETVPHTYAKTGTYTVSVADAVTSGSCTSFGSASAQFTYAVTAAPAFTADTPPATATNGTAYAYTFAASGDPAPTFAVTSGALPPGLTLNPGTGELSGTPTAGGSFTFEVSASNGIVPSAVTPGITITVSSVPTAACTQATALYQADEKALDNLLRRLQPFRSSSAMAAGTAGKPMRNEIAGERPPAFACSMIARPARAPMMRATMRRRASFPGRAVLAALKVVVADHGLSIHVPELISVVGARHRH